MRKFNDLTGKFYGLWQVVSRDVNHANGKTQWICMCECGTTKTITANSLTTGNSTSCGCNRMVDLVSKVFLHLIVVAPDYTSGRRMWACRCSCGGRIVASSGDLRCKRIISCAGSKPCSNMPIAKWFQRENASLDLRLGSMTSSIYDDDHQRSHRR